MTPEGRILARVKKTAKLLGLGVLRMHMGAGVEAGWPDTLILGPGRRVLWIETKRPKEKHMRPLQDHRAKELRALGFRVEKVNTVEAVDALLNEFATECGLA